MSSENMYTMTKVMTDLFVDSQFPVTMNTFGGMLTQADFWRVSLPAEISYNLRPTLTFVPKIFLKALDIMLTKRFCYPQMHFINNYLCKAYA